ncbi:MAG: hypothetical protein MI922_26335, partial [Bacteroidales bacterium]|nr:hypothetical protein [Bacteroidales bacterium]
EVTNIYISGGFAKNEIFVRYLASRYEHMSVYTSFVENATAQGAALVAYESLNEGQVPQLDLGLIKWKASVEMVDGV